MRTKNADHGRSVDVNLAAATLRLQRRAQASKRAAHRAPAQLRENTRKTYALAWDSFVAFCKAARRRALPAAPALVANYLTHLHVERRLAVKSIRMHKAAIGHYHRNERRADPNLAREVADTWAGILAENEDGVAKPTYALWRDSVHEIVDAIGDAAAQRRRPSRTERLTTARDRALLLVLASRTAHLAPHETYSLRIEQISPHPRGLALNVTRAADVESRHRVALLAREPGSYCPVRALEAWLRASGLRHVNGAVFRAVDGDGNLAARALSGAQLGRIVKSRAKLAGFDEDRLSARSLRHGSMLQAKYDGTPASTVVANAGLTSRSVPFLAPELSRATRLRRRRIPPPRGPDAVHLEPARRRRAAADAR